MAPFVNDSTSDNSESDALRAEINELLNQLPSIDHGGIIEEALTTLVRMAEVEADRLDWKILTVIFFLHYLYFPARGKVGTVKHVRGSSKTR